VHDRDAQRLAADPPRQRLGCGHRLFGLRLQRCALFRLHRLGGRQHPLGHHPVHVPQGLVAAAREHEVAQGTDQRPILVATTAREAGKRLESSFYAVFLVLRRVKPLVPPCFDQFGHDHHGPVEPSQAVPPRAGLDQDCHDLKVFAVFFQVIDGGFCDLFPTPIVAVADIFAHRRLLLDAEDRLALKPDFSKEITNFALIGATVDTRTISDGRKNISVDAIADDH